MRSKYFSLLILLICSIDVTTAQQQAHIPWPSLADSPWPVLRGDMQGTGRSEYIGPRTKNIAWVKDMPLGIIYGPVIGYKDILYMGERALSPDSVNYFYAVNKFGDNLWEFQTMTFLPNNSGPIVRKDSTIFFFSRNKNLYSLKPNGELNWKVENIWANFWPFYPLAKNGDLYVAIVDTLIVVSSAGIVKDRIIIPELSPAIVFSTGGDTIYFTSGGPPQTGNSGSINAADLNGNLYWSYNFDEINWGIPMVDNQNRIYVFGKDSITRENFLYCFNPNGSISWKYPVLHYLPYAAPTIDRTGNIILNARKIINAEQRDAIISLDYHGNENWITLFDGDFDEHYINHGLVCDAEGKIYCGSSSAGNFYCFDNDGTLLWQLDLGDLEYDSCPAIGSDGTLYIGTHISSSFIYHANNLIAIKDSGTSLVQDIHLPNKFWLNQNYPNPFNPNTTIKYSIPEVGVVSLDVYDLLGSKVASLVNEHQAAGNYSVQFDASSTAGGLPSGIYIYRLTSGQFTSSKKLILLK